MPDEANAGRYHKGVPARKPRLCPRTERTHFFQRPGQALITLVFRDVLYDHVWMVECGDTPLGVVVEPYSVLDKPPGIFVGLPLGVGSISAGYYANSWHDAVKALLSIRRAKGTS